MAKKGFTYVLFLTLMLVLAACSSDENVDEAAGGEGNAEDGSGGTINIGMSEDMVTVDPHGSNDSASAQIRRNIYESLIFQDENLELTPGLATEWEATEDTVWNFKLREGTTFHSGQAFTAEDVKATIDRVNDPAVASQVAFLYEMIEEVKVVGDYEVNLHTAYAFAPLPAHLSHNAGGIMSKDLIDRDYQAALDEAGSDVTLEEYYELREAGGDEFQAVADEISEYIGSVTGDETDGTNHLQLADRSPGDSVTLEKFEDFQNGEREFDEVIFRVIPETQARLAELETGGIDIAAEVDTASAERIQSADATELIESDSVRMNYLGFNMDKEPFDDPLIRQAIAYAVDRDQIIDGVYDGYGITAQSPLAPDVWGYDEGLESVEVDIDKAQELLSESSQPDGFSTTLWVNDDSAIVDSAVYIQGALSEIGIEVEIQQSEWGAFLDQTANGEHDMFILGWTTVTADADYGLYALFHSKNFGAPGNRSFYSNEEVDALLDEGRTTADETVRQEAYSEVQQILIDDAPAVYLNHTSFLLGVNNDGVNNIGLDPVGNIRLENASFGNAE
ncbi:Periplasmic dipeptide transport protein precursor [Jeotgalicoccus aerolatus]|uniref:Peptide/nickel transport system substrate-binding protein n=1 Tax=Jeotgalicoccus aerolatus TaxID=709510 RepID=A0ABS4HKX0_9STAP|nr:glutathione ABC transporter substrate-binding protein [Jeotgalicoccus aerolatus]MBP1951573.1 peptide/nickel transport system substrate-binding protein [Jeotgalicoccus aerolatus]GGD96471.1 diguanylate phosphodiesterase [Jeotgalicoccus aerolatus]CAD2076083.1 Periplasmic dipeptide transport protein precursor [Jeotgalicoccus aerolatus]